MQTAFSITAIGDCALSVPPLANANQPETRDALKKNRRLQLLKSLSGTSSLSLHLLLKLPAFSPGASEPTAYFKAL